MNITEIFKGQTDEQKAAFRTAQITGFFRDLAIQRGGTGYLRRQLTKKEAQKLINRKKMKKQSRKANRKAG